MAQLSLSSQGQLKRLTSRAGFDVIRGLYLESLLNSGWISSLPHVMPQRQCEFDDGQSCDAFLCVRNKGAVAAKKLGTHTASARRFEAFVAARGDFLSCRMIVVVMSKD